MPCCSYSKKECKRAAPKAIPPVLLCWPVMSEADIGALAVV